MPSRKTSPLSRRQRQCLEAKLERLTAKEAAKKLKISHNTVQMHWRDARSKLGVSSTWSAASLIERSEREAAGPEDDYPFEPDSGRLHSDLTLNFRSVLNALTIAVLGMIFLLSALFIAAAMTVLVIHVFQLDRVGPFYGILRNR